jgi:hypothetical protein
MHKPLSFEATEMKACLAEITKAILAEAKIKT